MDPIAVTPMKDKNMPIAPRTITPSFRTSEPSWEDLDEGLYGSAQKARRSNGKSFEEEEYQQPRITSASHEDEEMPMDEMMALTPGKASFDSTKPRALEPSESLSMPRIPAGSSNIGKITAALESNSSERPKGLNLEERMLWDAVQSTVINATRRPKKNIPSTSSAELELQANQKLRDFEINADAASPEVAEKMKELQDELKNKDALLRTKESEHDVEVRAIQRVLAEITAEREEESQLLNETVSSLSRKIETLEKEKASLQKGLPPPPPPPTGRLEPAESDYSATVEKLKETIKSMEGEVAAAKKEAERKTRHASLLERDYKVLKSQLKNSDEGKKGGPKNAKPSMQVEVLKTELAKMKERNQKLQAELDSAIKDRKARRKPYGSMGSMTPPRPEMTSHNDCDSVASSMSAEDVESLQKNLSETTSSLENAKKIIASLENANGSMAVDLRAKLKMKEEELVSVQKESEEQKRRLDSLATELRDLQKKQTDIERLESESKTQVVRQKALMGLLEKSVSGLQAASAIHEVATATGAPDKSNVEQISEILTDAMVAIRTSLEISENYIDEFDDETTVAFTDAEVSSEVGRQIDAIIKNDREAIADNIKNELDQKRVAVRRLEEALQKQNEEIRRLRRERSVSGDSQELVEEIQTLRERCSANMELLAKKDRELSVLRSTLNVDDADGGYISDDASEGDDENPTVSSKAANVFASEKSEALATLLAAGGSMPEVNAGLKNEFMKALEEKKRTEKELKAERDSLANAKLIISSLEKANKSMMEDLRSRLQDSNTAISSLLDQSSAHQKNSNSLREEVERLKQEKERLENQLMKGTPDFMDKVHRKVLEEKKEDPQGIVDSIST